MNGKEIEDGHRKCFDDLAGGDVVTIPVVGQERKHVLQRGINFDGGENVLHSIMQIGVMDVEFEHEYLKRALFDREQRSHNTGWNPKNFSGFDGL